MLAKSTKVLGSVADKFNQFFGKNNIETIFNEIDDRLGVKKNNLIDLKNRGNEKVNGLYQRAWKLLCVITNLIDLYLWHFIAY